ncbi:MAG TPA: DUF5996 family protein [Acidimicrobiia bacterium]|nr:DUF5996 family protein [Acidimicrobiia bacterium]
MNSPEWPALGYDVWRATCDTLHAHTQLLGKLAVALAPPEPQLQHAALRLTPRGWETHPLPAPDGSGFLVVAIDLREHAALVEHSDGTQHVIPLIPDRPVGDVTVDVVDAVTQVAGPVVINPRPQEVPWDVPLDEDQEHHTYDVPSVADYFKAATRVAMVLGELRAPYRGRVTPVNAWWGSFDLTISLFSGRSAVPPSDGFITRNSGNAQQIEVGWWPGDARYPRPAFFAFLVPSPDPFNPALDAPARWDNELGEYILDYDEVIAAADPHRTALEFGRAAITHLCLTGSWDTTLAKSATGLLPPID